jgi:integrase
LPAILFHLRLIGDVHGVACAERHEHRVYSGLHALRHFFASWCINPCDRGGLGLPPKFLQQLLGHSSIVMTMDTYGHLFPADYDVHARLAESAGALLDAT